MKFESHTTSAYIIQKRAIRICKKNAGYGYHSRPLSYQLKSLNIHDMVNFKSMVFMYRVYNKLLTANIMSYFKQINASHNHNVCMKNCNFKSSLVELIRNRNALVYKGRRSGMTCLLILNCVSRCLHLKKCAKLYFCNRINLVNAFDLIVCNDYRLSVSQLTYILCKTCVHLCNDDFWGMLLKV